MCYCHDETRLTLYIQRTVLISGRVTLQSLGALWCPHPPSVHGLSCRGPGYSERCHTPLRRHLPRFQRMTLRTVWASRKYSSLEQKTQDSDLSPADVFTDSLSVSFCSQSENEKCSTTPRSNTCVAKGAKGESGKYSFSMTVFDKRSSAAE